MSGTTTKTEQSSRGGYSATSKVTREVCEAIGATYEIQFVESLRRGGKTYVRGTCGKPEEFWWLRKQCEDNGFIYTGINP